MSLFDFIIDIKKISHCLQKWDLRYFVCLSAGRGYFPMETKNSRMKRGFPFMKKCFESVEDMG